MNHSVLPFIISCLRNPWLVGSGRGYQTGNIRLATNNITSYKPSRYEPMNLRTKQRDDGSLRQCSEEIDKEMETRFAGIQFFVKKRIIYRKYTLRSTKQMQQFVVPRNLRHFVMTMAHSGILAGHQGIKRTADHVLEVFYCPLRRHVICLFLRYLPEECSQTFCTSSTIGKHFRHWYSFKSVAVDIQVPLASISEEDNKCVLDDGRYGNTVSWCCGTA